jgi:hypothetical protein
MTIADYAAAVLLIRGGSPAFFWAVFVGGGAINIFLWWRYAPELLMRRT